MKANDSLLISARSFELPPVRISPPSKITRISASPQSRNISGPVAMHPNLIPAKGLYQLLLARLKSAIKPDISMAAIKTISTFELLEHILLILDLRTLLCAQCVCTAFGEVIQNSPRVQKALFFEPLSSPTVAEINLMKIWESCDYGNNKDVTFASILLEGVPKVTPVNPLLTRYLFYGLGLPGYRCPSKNIYVSHMRPKILQKLYDSPDSASWRRMLVVQPHASPMDVITDFTTGGSRKTERGSLASGLRMGSLVDYEVHARRTLNGKAEREEMKLTCCGYYYDTVRVSGDLKFVLGSCDILDLYGREIEKAAKDICGWDVLSPGFGTQAEPPRPFLGHPRGVWGPRNICW